MTNLGTIPEARRQLLEKLRRGELKVASAPLDPPIPRAGVEQGPLSPGQQQVWFRAKPAAGIALYNESMTIHKRGPLDRGILERCFNEIARRHQIWRSVFSLIDGEVVQRIDPNVRIHIPFVDLSHLPVEEREAESVRIGTEDVRLPFDLSAAPLFRLRLVRWADDYHRIYLTLHQLVYDCFSINRVLISELAALYDAFSAGQPSPLAELDLQYSDYAVWKQQQVTRGIQSGKMDYWRENFSEDLPAVQLPTDRPNPGEPTWRAAMETFTLPKALTEALKEFRTTEGATLYMILLAVFQVVLYRSSGQEEIVLSGAINARTRPELEPLIGYFLNAVVLRSNIRADLSFRDFLGCVKSTVLDALSHSDIPFDAVMRELGLQRDSGRHPLHQVLFSMRSPIKDFPEGWKITGMEVHNGVSAFDLFLELAEHPAGMTGRFVYRTDLFERATILRLVTDFQTSLQQLLANPDQPVSQAPVHTELPASEFAPTTHRESVPPQDDIEERLINIWQEVLGVHSIGVTDNYFDLGGHSVLALQLFTDIKFSFQLDLPLATLFYAPTIRAMAALIRDSGVQAAAPIVPIQPNGTKPPIFCIGALNGEVILFRRLGLELGPDQPLFGLQPFSLVDKLSTVETLAASYIEKLHQSGERQPFCLLGYSFGGLVAVEMARQLGNNGVAPPLVALIDSPYLAATKALEPWNQRLRRYRYHVHQIVRGSGGLHHLADRLRCSLFRTIHKASTTIGVGMPKMASDISGRQLLAAESYRAKPYPGQVCLFKAESRPEFFDADPELGWGGILSNLRIEEVPGDHGTMNTGTNMKVLARKLTAILEDSPSVRKEASRSDGGRLHFVGHD
jgi:thioesterase domain-containing protein/acyl carrier protein